MMFWSLLFPISFWGSGLLIGLALGLYYGKGF